MALEGAKDGALFLFVADSYKVACASLSAVRLELGKKLELIDYSQYKFLWVNDFPPVSYTHLTLPTICSV